MDVIYGLIPGMILLGLVAVGIFFWAARSGQFDDMEGEAHRILMDDDFLGDGKDSDDDGKHATPDEPSQDEPGKPAA